MSVNKLPFRNTLAEVFAAKHRMNALHDLHHISKGGDSIAKWYTQIKLYFSLILGNIHNLLTVGT